MKTLTGLLVTVVALGSLSAALAEDVKAPQKPKVEVVFVLDTTGSMSGLIAAAKQKIWAIANTLASARPAPDIRMGLVGYRDRGDAYVTQLTDLNDDLDAIYARLMAFQAGGGGDTPESVNQALHEAVTKIAWSKGAKTYRVIFLVGDCPPHMDYKDDVKYPVTCKAAAEAGIVINSIQCGNSGGTTPIWKDIADRAEGRFFKVEQSGGAVVTGTPFDGELAELGGALAATRVHYGTAAEQAALRKRAKAADETAAAAPTAARASRGVFMSKAAGEKTLSGGKDLVADATKGEVKLDELKEEELPEVMRDMKPEQRQKYLAERSARRTALQAEINALAAKRQQYIKAKVEEANKAGGKQSLDAAIYDSIRKQAAKCGITYEGGPSY